MRTKPLLLGLIIILTYLSAVACAGPVVSPTAQPQIAGTTVPTPLSGKSVAIGMVRSESTGEPLGNTIVRLAEVYRQDGEGAFVLDGARSPGAITDPQGHFLIPEIEPVEYVVIIGDVFGEYVILDQPNGEAQVWTAEADQILDLGVLEVALGQ